MSPGAFSWKEGGGQWVQILPAHDRRAMPLGKAWIYEEGDWALAQLHLNLDTQAGKDWHSTLKFDLAKGSPVQEWSYGYQVLDADFQVRGDQRVQVLKRLDVDEISPVIRGAGNGTGTISIKSAELKEAHYAPLIAALGELAESLPADPRRSRQRASSSSRRSSARSAACCRRCASRREGADRDRHGGGRLSRAAGAASPGLNRGQADLKPADAV
jgi:hypothetical protein